MDEKNYFFRLSSYDTEKLLPQVSKALEMRTELLSREQYPGLWSAIEKLRSLSRGKTRSKTRSKVMGIIYLALGIFLFIPGLINPTELTGPLLIGGFGVLAGIFNLWCGQKQKKNPFDRSAKLLLDSKADLSAELGIEVVFTEAGVDIPSDSDALESVPYDSFECAIKGPDLFLFVFETRVTVLQKCDLISGESEEFWDFISEKVSKNCSFP